MIYKTILTFWWQNNGTLEFRSQCHIFGWYIDIILTRCFRTIAIHLRIFLKTLEGDFKIQKENKKLYLGDSQMVNFLTRNLPVVMNKWVPWEQSQDPITQPPLGKILLYI